jgi:hypothetical protein
VWILAYDVKPHAELEASTSHWKVTSGSYVKEHSVLEKLKAAWKNAAGVFDRLKEPWPGR